jgi:Kdo2-lipid IVA lauroyltransferase/acyltransferase
MMVFAVLPLWLFRFLGLLTGLVLLVFAMDRRRVAWRNLSLCFPDRSPAKRAWWLTVNFVCFACSLFDRLWLWHAPLSTLDRRIRFEGDLSGLQGEAPRVVFVPHFMGLDAGGLWLSSRVKRPWTVSYTRQRKAWLDRWMNAGRTRFGAALAPKHQGVRPLLKALRQGGLLHFSPDMDLGRPQSIFVNFFGVVAATVPALPRLSAMGQAPVMALVTRVTWAGYTVRLMPVWDNYPTGNEEQDVREMNARLESYIREMPAQYYWPHRRFKTRPEGQPPIY